MIRSDGVVVVNKNSKRPEFIRHKLAPRILNIYKTSCYPDEHQFTGDPPIFDRFSFSQVKIPEPQSQKNFKNDKNAKNSQHKITLKIFHQKPKQFLQGFGGALTDAVCINLKKLGPKLGSDLMALYYGKNSADYKICRVPISSCDFSARCYTYLDTKNDFDCSTFALQPEDEDKIFWMKFINSGSNRVNLDQKIDFLCSSWSPPIWMKTNQSWKGKGGLIGQPGNSYHKCWARYLIKFLDAYHQHGLNFAYMTLQNEPTNGYVIPAFWQSCGFSPEHMRDFVKLDLVPAMQAAGYLFKTKLIMLDDVRLWLPWRADTILDPENSNNNQFIEGIGTHWYMNYLVPKKVIEMTHNKHPDKFILATEACHEATPIQWKDKNLNKIQKNREAEFLEWQNNLLSNYNANETSKFKQKTYKKSSRGSPRFKWPWDKEDKQNLIEHWKRGEDYSKDIIESLNNFQSGWVDWNLCLDENGGPNWANNRCDSPLIVTTDFSNPDTAKEFLIQPMFYHLLHFSKLLAGRFQEIHTSEIDTSKIHTSKYTLQNTHFKIHTSKKHTSKIHTSKIDT